MWVDHFAVGVIWVETDASNLIGRQFVCQVLSYGDRLAKDFDYLVGRHV